jgi:hypothetical protein
MICRMVSPEPIASMLETTKPSMATVTALFNRSISMAARSRCGRMYAVNAIGQDAAALIP